MSVRGITHTGSVLDAVMRLVNCILSSFHGDSVALNIAKTGAFSKNRLKRVEQGYSGELQITMILQLNDSYWKLKKYRACGRFHGY